MLVLGHDLVPCDSMRSLSEAPLARALAAVDASELEEDQRCLAEAWHARRAPLPALINYYPRVARCRSSQRAERILERVGSTRVQH